MGGIGSGNRWQSGASTTDEYLRIDVRVLARSGALSTGYRGSLSWSCNGAAAGSIRFRADLGSVVLSYRHRTGRGDWVHEEYLVPIVYTRCHLGGCRPWFLCPVVGCGRRVAILYGGAIFACRHCYQLAYPSTRESADDRATRRADRIRARLGWESGILNGGGCKPKRMRWRTFERVTAELERKFATAMAAW